jgi:GT2 family glycosyltransferase
MMKIDILILNYNGKDLVKAYLPSVIEASKGSCNECNVHVVDNLSTDGSNEMILREFPEVCLHIARQNRVLCSYNEVVEKLDSDIVIFLNNDIKVEPDFVDRLARHFNDKKVMFAAPRLINFDGTYNGGRSFLKFEFGAIKMIVDKDAAAEPGPTKAISTGAFRRKMFLELGGFDDLYLPGIWEDVDICYRGLLSGWKGIYEPGSVIWHDESTTFHREYGKKGKMRIAHRNMFLFFWKNITDKKMLLTHVFLILPRGIIKYCTGATEILEGFILALKKLPSVLKKRKEFVRWKKNRTILRDRDLVR